MADDAGRVPKTNKVFSKGAQVPDPVPSSPRTGSSLEAVLAASGGGNDSAFQRHAGLIQAARSGTASNPALYEAIYELHATYGNAYVQRLVAHVDAQTVAEDVTQSPSVKSAEEEDTYPVTPEVASRIDMERPSGRPLDNDTRSDIEASLGRDLGNVRLHDDAESDELSRLVEAEAFTSREDVFVRGDGFDASTGHDRQVLAHELTHVLSNAGQSGIQRYSETTGGEEETSEDEGDVDEATARDMPDKNLLEFIDAGQEDLVQYVDGDELSDGQRLRLIEIALKLHEYEAMRRLWQSFSSLEEAAAANFDLWSRCAETDDGLFALPEILDIEDAFRADVTTVRNLSLQMSRESAEAELMRYGIDPAGGQGNPDALVEQQASVQQFQAVATLVAGALEAQEQMSRTRVAYREATPSGIGDEGSQDFGDGVSEDYDPAEETSPELVPILFDPFLEVDDTADDLVPGDAPWFELKEHYDSTNEIIGYWSGQFPAIYALIRDGLGSGAMMDNLSVEADGQQALSTIEQSLRQVLADIAAAEALQLDPLDLKPIHERLYSGGHGLNLTTWDDPFYRSIAEHLVAQHEALDWWAIIGLGVLAASLIVTFAFTGPAGAAVVVGMVGAGLSVAEAISRSQKADDLATAADATMSDEWAIVDESQAQIESDKAKLALAFALLDVIGIGFELRALKAAATVATESTGLVTAGARGMPETALGDDAIESAGYLDEAAERGAADEVLEGADGSTPGSRLDEGADEIPRTEADEAEGAAREPPGGTRDETPDADTEPPGGTREEVPPGGVPAIPALPTIERAALPAEAHTTLGLIDSGGPFPHAQDGIEFRNRESLLPVQGAGYYEEYTVRTPGVTNRGARRIVKGQGGEMYYTDDHYASFRRIV